MNSEFLDQLIAEGEALGPTITFIPPGPNVIRTFSVYNTSDPGRYQDWQSSSQRFIKTHHPSEVEEVKQATEKLSPDNHRKILGILRAVKVLPSEPVKLQATNTLPTNNIQITNNQNNTQQVTVNLFLEAIKDELTGKDFKEIKEILKDFEAEPVKTKNKLLERVKGFGGDVLSNIVANILTNPTIYNGLF